MVVAVEVANVGIRGPRFSVPSHEGIPDLHGIGPRPRHEEVEFDCTWLDGDARQVRAFVDPSWALRFRLGGDNTSPRGSWVEVPAPRR